MRNIHWVMIMVGAIIVTAMIAVLVSKNNTAKKLQVANSSTANGFQGDTGTDLNGETELEQASRIAHLTAGFGGITPNQVTTVPKSFTCSCDWIINANGTKYCPNFCDLSES